MGIVLIALGIAGLALLVWAASMRRPPPEAPPINVRLDPAPPDFGRASFDDVGVDEEDMDPDRDFLPTKQADNLGWRVLLHYVTSGDIDSARVISIDAIYAYDLDEYPDAPYYVTAWCHNAKARRTFRSDRAKAFGVIADNAGRSGEVPLYDRPTFTEWVRASLAARQPLDPSRMD